MSSTPPDVVPEGTKSPKHLSFVIDFGNSKTFDTQRHKALVEKFQNRHKRGQSLSKLDELPKTASSSSKAQPSSGSLPRKNSFQSEGYFSCDERGDHIKNNCTINKNVQYSRLRADLRLPLKNINSDKMTQSFPNDSIILSSIKSPDIELQDVSSPELDLISPFSPLSVKPASPVLQEKKLLDVLPTTESHMWEETIEISDTNSNKFVDGMEFDFDKSDTPSETGTYTLDTDNYTVEQKARMSIDRDFNIEQISGKQKTEEYVQSLNRKEKVHKCPVSKTFIAERPSRQNGNTSFNQCESPNFPLLRKVTHEEKMKVVAPILSPTQNLSITDKINCTDKDQTRKPKDVGIDQTTFDKGCITSISASGAFGRKNNITNKTHCSKTSLTKSQVETQVYIDPGHKNNYSIQAAESQRSDDINNTKDGEIINVDLAINRLSKLPPVIGGSSGKTSPSKIPSPVHSVFNRPRSRNSVADSDSSLETESFLKPTQNYINSLQKRLSLDSNQDGDFQKYNLRLNNEIQKMAHIRNNSFDDKNLQVSNKLEHFQNKSLQGIDQTYINKFNQFSNSVHKIHNSPNNSPIQRSSSFSTNKNGNVQRKITNLTVCSVPKKNNLSNSSKLDQNNSTQSAMKSYLLRVNHTSNASEHSRVISQFGDTESSSEEDFEKHSLRKKDLSNLTSTRYNRAFALRRARLDEPPAPKCPNTPEMRRKFQATEHIHSERALSVDRRPIKMNSTPSRYLQNATKIKTADKIETPKNVPKYSSEKSQALSRTDSGRFSMRSSKPNITNKQKNTVKEFGGKKHTGGRSNSSLSSREMEFQNWKRRKSYDPMKAAAEGKKKVELAKKQCQNTMTQSYNENQLSQDCDSSPSHSSSVHRSQSFHGTAALAQLISSEEEDDFTLSADEGFSPPAPSPYKLSPARVISRQAWRGKLLN